MTIREPTAAQFLYDVERHQMRIMRDDGVYRHVRMQQPQNSNMWFELVTWPGNLTIRGDMGTWTFSRVEDMFTFFRNPTLGINPSYWAEKIQNGVSGGRSDGGAQQFSRENFAEGLLDQLENYFGLEGERLAEVRQSLKDEVLSNEDLSHGELMRAAADFKHGDFRFDPCELPSGMVYRYHFLWCLYAIVWTIHVWDKGPVSPMNSEGV